jgi:hypothetical protein
MCYQQTPSNNFLVIYMGVFREYNRFLAIVPVIILWGCFGGICLAIVNFFLLGIWDPVLEYNDAFSLVYRFQMMGSFTLLFWILGTVAADLFRTGRDSWLDSVITGLLSGICTALVFTVIIVSNDMVSHPSIVHYANDPFQIRIFLDRLFQHWLVPLAGFILASGILQALGAWYHGSRQRSASDKADTRRTLAVSGRLYSYRFLVLTLLTVLIIPPGLAYLGMGAGIIEKQNTCCPLFDSVEASRTGPDSIRIIFKRSPDLPEIKTGTARSINITIDEKDVSAQSIIAKAGFVNTIDPPEGLRYYDGAFVILSGDDIKGNDGVPVHLIVMVKYPDLGYDAVICDMRL